MKSSKIAGEQIIRILSDQEWGARVAEICHGRGIRSTTAHAWKAKFGAMDGQTPSG